MDINADKNIDANIKPRKKYKTKLNKEDKRTKTIAFRVTEREYKAFKSNKKMQTLIIKYCRLCLQHLYITNE